jgi:hypothetical protein
MAQKVRQGLAQAKAVSALVPRFATALQSLPNCAAPARLLCSRWAKPLLRAAATLVLGGTFAYAGAEKLLAPAEFAVAIANYRLPLLHAPAIHAVAFVLPVLEVVLAVSLFIPALRRGALVGMGGLLVLFMAALAQAFARGIVVDCGCFGSATTASIFSMGAALARDVVLLAVVAFLWRASKNAIPQPTTITLN